MKIVKEIIKYLALGFALFILATIIETVFGITTSNVLTNKKVELTEMKDILVVEEEVTNMDIDIEVATLNIKEGEFKVETNNPKVTAYINDNKLVVKDNTNKLANNDKTVVNIYIPASYEFDYVNINAGVGKNQINNLVASNIKLDLGIGETIINGLTSLTKMNLNTGVGNLEINDALINNLTCELGIGKTTFKGIVTGTSKISTGIGEANINLYGNMNDYMITFEKGLGNIYFRNNKVADGYKTGTGINNITIEGGIGEAHVNIKEINEN